MNTPFTATRTDKLRLLAGLIATESSKFSDAKIDQVLELVRRSSDELIQEAPEDVKRPLITRDIGALLLENGIAVPEGYCSVDAPESPVVKNEDKAEVTVEPITKALSLTSDTGEDGDDDCESRLATTKGKASAEVAAPKPPANTPANIDSPKVFKRTKTGGAIKTSQKEAPEKIVPNDYSSLDAPKSPKMIRDLWALKPQVRDIAWSKRNGAWLAYLKDYENDIEGAMKVCLACVTVHVYPYCDGGWKNQFESCDLANPMYTQAYIDSHAALEVNNEYVRQAIARTHSKRWKSKGEKMMKSRAGDGNAGRTGRRANAPNPEAGVPSFR